MPKLIVSLPDGTEHTHEMTEDVVTVGRLHDNQLEIDDVSVSSHHAQLMLEGGDYHLKDLNSTNGTRVNGQNISEQQLQDGDLVRFGKIEAHYHSEIPASRRPVPEAAKLEHAAAESSHKPTDFENASPFQTKAKPKDAMGKLVIALAVAGFLAFAGAVALILQIQPPQ